MLISASVKGRAERGWSLMDRGFDSDTESNSAGNHRSPAELGGRRPVPLDCLKLSLPFFSEQDVHCALSLRSNEL